MFRQHAHIAKETPARQARHWLMNNSTGRELLKTAAARRNPLLGLPYFRCPPSIDAEIEPYIDKLGLRNLQAPTDEIQLLSIEIYLLWRTIKASFLGR
tara:strand:+ start:982 stop:1275 length:294 start_codon:yes stop_codon:yes gene_type:complete